VNLAVRRPASKLLGMESTLLNLLTRDGMLTVEITPELDSEHYTLLHLATKDASTADDMREAITVATGGWDRKVKFL
jgi:hypothetical protein